MPPKSSPQGEKRWHWERITASSGAKTPFCHHQGHLLPLRDRLKQHYPSQKEEANKHGDTHPTTHCLHMSTAPHIAGEIRDARGKQEGKKKQTPKNKAVIGLAANSICNLGDSCVTTKGPSLELSQLGEHWFKKAMSQPRDAGQPSPPLSLTQRQHLINISAYF